jgi:predicted RNA-binding Zn-ribbon protein involved in translation (DUF1610 family)
MLLVLVKQDVVQFTNPMTQIINIYGGPCIGKSSTSAFIYYLLKKNKFSAELVQEYVKEWAWEDRKIKPFDQIYFFAKQVRKESMLFGKVDFIITDSPVLLSLAYIKRVCDPEIAAGLEQTARAFYEVSPRHGVHHVHVMLKRNGKFNSNGRFHSEEESIKIEGEVIELLKSIGFEYTETSYSEEDLQELCNQLTSSSLYKCCFCGTKVETTSGYATHANCPKCGLVDIIDVEPLCQI